MVGAVGRGDSPSEINLSVMHGNISIKEATGTRQPKQAEQTAGPAHTETAAAHAQPPADDTPSDADPRLDILESLRKGEITVDEAVSLLDRAS